APGEEKQGANGTVAKGLSARLMPGTDLQIEIEAGGAQALPGARVDVAAGLLAEEAHVFFHWRCWRELVVGLTNQVGRTIVPASQPAIRVIGSNSIAAMDQTGALER